MKLVDRIINLFYPPKCIFCGDILYDGMVCETCEATLEFVNHAEWAHNRRSERRNYDGVIPTFYYAGNARNAVARLKFKGNKKSAKILSRYMSGMFWRAKNTYLAEDFDVIVPVPMHKTGQKARGYNQSELLAEELSELIHLPLCTNAVYKLRRNKVQHNLTHEKREENVRGIYSLGERHSIEGKNVLLVDDVLTTGNTASACAGILKQGGAKKVWIIVVAVAK